MHGYPDIHIEFSTARIFIFSYKFQICNANNEPIQDIHVYEFIEFLI